MTLVMIGMSSLDLVGTNKTGRGPPGSRRLVMGVTVRGPSDVASSAVTEWVSGPSTIRPPTVPLLPPVV